MSVVSFSQSPAEYSIHQSPRSAESPRSQDNSVQSDEYAHGRLDMAMHALERLSGVVADMRGKVERLELAVFNSGQQHLQETIVSLGEEQPASITESRVAAIEKELKQLSKLVSQSSNHEEHVLTTDRANRPSEKSYLPVVPASIDESARSTRPTYFSGLDSDDETTHMWNLAQSCWDAAVFFGSRQVFRPLESGAIALSLLMNVSIQISFVIIVYLSLANSSLDDRTISGYHLWRTTTGHLFQYMDPMTQHSLTSRVCSADPSLHVSNAHSEMMQDINRYLYLHAPFNGPLLCMLALITWALTISKEIHVVVNMFEACVNISRDTTAFSRNEDGSLSIESLGTGRIGVILFLGLLRGSIAFALLVAGAKYLAVTISIENIMLNAVALEFVLNIDELLFESVVPLSSQRVIAKIKPVRLRKLKFAGGLDFTVLSNWIGLCGFLATTVLVWLAPEMQSMRDAEQELCHGTRDFSYSLTASTNAFWASESKTVTADDRIEQFKRSSRYKVLRGAIDGTNNANALTKHKLSALQGNGWSVMDLGNLDMREYGAFARILTLLLIGGWRLRWHHFGTC